MVRIHPDPLLIMKIALVVSQNNKKAQSIAGEVERYLKKGKHEVAEKPSKGVDFVITLGGDGTLLHTACKYADLDTPFCGINVGTLGFLTAAEGDDWRSAIDKLVNGKYVISERMMVEAMAGDRKLRAVNEVVVKGLYRVVDLEISVSGQKLLDVVGDGIIVATQTGSTAYSLSAGGPIVDPDLDSLLLTPINSIGLPIPSVVLSPDDVVEIKVKRGDDVSLTADGQEHTRLETRDVVRVAKGEKRVKFTYFDAHQFISSLNAKFGLGKRGN